MRTPILKLLPLARSWLSFVRRRTLALLLIPFGLVTTTVRASDEPVIWTPVSLKQSERTRYDLELTLRARRLLIEDPALARFDIAVRVDDRVADLRGTVPSMEVALRAENDLRGLLGLANIRNQLAIKEPARSLTINGDSSPTDSTNASRFQTSTSSATLKPELGSRPIDMPAEPSFSWRPVRPGGSLSLMPMPFLAEGLGRPTKPPESIPENDTTNGENLRIGKIDVIKMPAEVPHTPEVFLLAPIDAPLTPENAVKSKGRLLTTQGLPFLFIGY